MDPRRVSGYPKNRRLPSFPPRVATRVVLVGRFTPDRRSEMAAAVNRGGGEPQGFLSPGEVDLGALGQLRPNVVFLDGAEPVEAAGFVAQLRGDVALHSVPVVWVASSAADGAFVAGHAAGADDAVVLGDDAAVTRRVAVLSEVDPAFRPELTQGAGVVAHADLDRRRILGRTLRAAGFDPAFAADAGELAAAVRGRDAVLVVASESLPGGGGLAACRDAAVRVPIVLLAPSAVRRAIESEAREAGLTVRVAPEDSPAADLLFLANDLLRPDVRNLRSSARHLHATVCLYRPAGELHGAWGLTYNLSREGLYLRTLDAPKAASEVWLELRPPGDRAAIHLRGEVVWARPPQLGAASAPPGFAVRLDPASCPVQDLEAYGQAYERLAVAAS